jgi:hypothetical protein
MSWDRAGAWNSGVAGLSSDGSKITSTLPIFLLDGLSTALSLAFASEPTLGLYRSGAGLLSIMGGNVSIGTTGPGAGLQVSHVSASEIRLETAEFPVGASATLGFYQGATKLGHIQMISPSSTNVDMRFSGWKVNALTEFLRFDSTTGNVYTTSGNVGIGTPAPDGQLSTGLANGQQISYKSLSELTTIAAAATTDTVIQIPANVIVKAVSVRVVTVIPTAATFTVTGATSTTVFNTAAVSTAANSTDKGNLNCPYNNGAAQKIRITPNATPAAATGQVRITVWYEDSIAPTS